MMPWISSNRFKKNSVKKSSDITANENRHLIHGEEYKAGNL